MRRRATEPPGGEITPESLFLGRREFIKNGALAAGTAAVVGSGLLWLIGNGPPPDAPEEQTSAPAPVQVADVPPPIQPAAPPKSGPFASPRYRLAHAPGF